ncbi:aldo/keto reductase [Ligilactobacillus acidipiscis]|jgi:L-glyceraldehyde 3-phosphate reductase|uniref:aldo/keto reductase n=1 Tax=Ligilactobacillus acidipiscis TaxID=89059 RepID=UPI002FDAFAF0
MYVADDDRYNKLPHRRVGETGLRLPLISLGLWHSFSSADPLYDRKRVILKAFDQGVFSFDCADHYGSPEIGTSESLLGQVLAAELKPYRDELVITSKVGYRTIPGPYGHFLSRKTILQSIDRTLERLQSDYVDIYYAHRFDPNTDLWETAQALDDVVRAGKALYIGISNFDTEQAKTVAKMFDDLGTPYTVNQISYNMLNRRPERIGLVDEMKRQKRGIVAYGPLAEGLLSDRYLDGVPADFAIHPTSKYVMQAGADKVTEDLNKLNDIAKKRGQTLSQMALAWLLRDPVVSSVIIGTTNIDHLQDNLEAAKNIRFDQEELDAIDAITK